MSGEIISVSYEITPEKIESKRAQYEALTADTPAGYEAVRVAVADCRTTRVAIEKRRVELKADALAFGRRVDAVAKELTSLVESIEEPLKLKKAAVDEEKERIRAEKAAEERRKIEEGLRVLREAKEAEERAAREAEEARLAEERAALAAERAALAEKELEQAMRERAAREALRIEREALEAERRKIEAEREAAIELERLARARVQAEADARELARREAIAAEEERVADAERAEALRLRLEALQPDQVKLARLAPELRAISLPSMATEDGAAVLNFVRERLEEALAALDTFQTHP